MSAEHDRLLQLISMEVEASPKLICGVPDRVKKKDKVVTDSLIGVQSAVSSPVR
jgi:hypothetical protein